MKNKAIEANSSNAFEKIQKFASLTVEAALKALQSQQEGLGPESVETLQRQFGSNEVSHEKAPSVLKQLGQSFLTPFNMLLLIVALVSLFTDVFLVPVQEREYKTVLLVTTMVLLSSLIRFWQEFRSNAEAEKLKGMIKTAATVIRGGLKQELDIKQLVTGDIVILSAGDMVPADCRVIQAKDLFLSQSILTGESVPVEKHTEADLQGPNKSPLELDNTCFMGTNVVSGSGMLLVVSTGDSTYFGSLSKTLTGKKVETNFDKGVNSVSWLLIRFIFLMVPIVFLLNGFTKHDWLQAFLFALTVAVGLTPEMLPMIVTTNLAKGAVNMSKRKVIVKKLNAIQNIGAMNILCTDKTGTLTQDKISLQLHLNIMGANDAEVLKWAYLNSFHQTGLKNLLDVAVLDHVEVNELLVKQAPYHKVDEIPFDFQRRRMSVVLQQDSGQHLLICKGALEEMLPLCTHAFDPGDDHALHIENDQVILMDNAMKTRIMETANKMNADGFRVLLVAIRHFDSGKIGYGVSDEAQLILTGFIGFLDPPKPSARQTIADLQQLGIQVKVLTGDNETVTRKICSDVGLAIGDVLLGPQIEKMDDAALGAALVKANILAKLSPMQKGRIIQLLRAGGHAVGFMGDGINDAPALRAADVGISVDTAVDIAKESADIILLEKDLSVLKDGVVLGRNTFGNIIKYIKMTASSNFGNMFSVLGASAFLPFLPMLPIQILTQNLLYDISQVSIPWDTMDKEFIEKPQKWNASGITRFMIYIGPISSIFDYATFALMFFVFKANSPAQQSLFQSGWFIEGLLSQTLIVHMIRTRKVPFIQSWATAPVVALTSAVMLLAAILPFTPIAAALKMQALPLNYFPYLLAILLAYCVLTQMVKVWFIKRFDYWL